MLSCNKELHVIAHRQHAADICIPFLRLCLQPRAFLLSCPTPGASCCSNLLNYDPLQFSSLPMGPDHASFTISALPFVNCHLSITADCQGQELVKIVSPLLPWSPVYIIDIEWGSSKSKSVSWRKQQDGLIEGYPTQSGVLGVSLCEWEYRRRERSFVGALWGSSLLLEQLPRLPVLLRLPSGRNQFYRNSYFGFPLPLLMMCC